MTRNRDLAALPRERFVGRAAEIELIREHIAVAGAIQGPPLLISGPLGIGKSELIEQTALRLSGDSEEWLPIVVRIDRSPYRSDFGAPSAERWIRLIAKALAYLAPAHWAGGDPTARSEPPAARDIVGAAHEAGLGHLAGRLRDLLALASSPSEQASPHSAGRPAPLELWSDLLASAAGLGLRPVLLLQTQGMESSRAASDGASGADFDAEFIGQILQGCSRAGVPAVVEAGRAVATPLGDAGPVQVLRLGGLTKDDVSTLAENLARAAEIVLPDSVVGNIVSRLSGNPGLIKDWILAFTRHRNVRNITRRAEESYLALIHSGSIATQWEATLGRELADLGSDRIERVLAEIAGEEAANSAPNTEPRFGPSFSARELAERAGLRAGDVLHLVESLAAEGFLEAQGGRFRLGPNRLLRDWISMRASLSAEADDTGRAQVDFIRNRLIHREVTTDAHPGSVPSPDILGRFDLQHVPQALLHFNQYYEALGEIPPEERETAVIHATQTIRLPETIGLVYASAPRRSVTGKGAEHHLHEHRPKTLVWARAFREGIYARSHEETWIVGDYTDRLTLTTDELDRFIEDADAIESRLGPGRYIRWVLIDESVSPEALEQLAERDICCTGSEQYRILTKLMDAPDEEGLHGEGKKGAVVAAPSGASSSVKAQGQIQAGAQAQAQAQARAQDRTPISAPVIPVLLEPSPGGTRSTRLFIVAQQDNETVAAGMAEKIARRSGFDEGDIGQIRTAVLEGCLNAIEHSSNAEKEVRLTFVETSSALEICIENEGPAFDPLTVEEPSLAEKIKSENKRGWGIKLMREFMDEVLYEHTNRGVRLRLIKRLPPAGLGASGAVDRGSNR